MLLTITTTHTPATDLGYLLHKNPGRIHETDLSFGRATLLYPVASPEVCTAAILLEVDPVALVRGRSSKSDGLLDQYVNDRPYAASSFFSVAISRMLGTALSGRSKERPELASTPIPLEIVVSALPCRGGESFLRRLFEPLGYLVEAQRHALDPEIPAWGESRYFTVTLKGTLRLRDALRHLYVLIPVLDAEKHYWVGDAEVDKLISKGSGWLESHPEKEEIARRYLKRARGLVRDAIRRLTPEEPESADDEEPKPAREETIERPLNLNETRIDTVLQTIRDLGASSIIDLGCGEGKLLRKLLHERSLQRIAGMDVSTRSLENAARRLRLDEMPSRQRERIELLHGSLMYRDRRLEEFDAATVVEVIEHLDPPRLSAFEQVVFGSSGIASIIVTTPNSEYNVRFENLPAATFRHHDHRFEWTRSEFSKWCSNIAARYEYDFEIVPIGTVDPDLGPPTQMAVFRKRSAS